MSETATVDRLHSEILRAGEDPKAMSALLAEWQPSDHVLLALLRRAVPQAFLELVARTEPWSNRASLLSAIITNPRADKALSLRLLAQLPWRALATVAATPWVPSVVRLRGEALLAEALPDLKLGERIALARIATRALVVRLISDPDRQVVEAALLNPRLTPEDLLATIRRAAVPRLLLEAAAASARWQESYALRLALVLQTRTPIAVALAQVSGLTGRDLARVEAADGLVPLVRAAARRVRETRRSSRRRGESGEPEEGEPEN
jgi:hypothetical protein